MSIFLVGLAMCLCVFWENLGRCACTETPGSKGQGVCKWTRVVCVYLCVPTHCFFTTMQTNLTPTLTCSFSIPELRSILFAFIWEKQLNLFFFFSLGCWDSFRCFSPNKFRQCWQKQFGLLIGSRRQVNVLIVCVCFKSTLRSLEDFR